MKYICSNYHFVMFFSKSMQVSVERKSLNYFLTRMFSISIIVTAELNLNTSWEWPHIGQEPAPPGPFMALHGICIRFHWHHFPVSAQMRSGYTSTDIVWQTMCGRQSVTDKKWQKKYKEQSFNIIQTNLFTYLNSQSSPLYSDHFQNLTISP